MDYQFNKKSQGSSDTKKSKRYVLNRIITPTGIAFWTVVAISYIGDRFFHVLSFVFGYVRDLIYGTPSPMEPYTDILAMTGFILMVALLIHKKTKLIDSLAVSLATVIATIASFEFTWDFLFLINQPITSWFGFPGSFWTYVFAFNSITAIWFIGIKYWKFRWYTWLAVLSYPLSFVIWYLLGYPQPWYSSSIDEAYLLNVSVKIFSFFAFMSPVLTFALSKNRFSDIEK